jgi:hypothetical protein
MVFARFGVCKALFVPKGVCMTCRGGEADAGAAVAQAGQGEGVLSGHVPGRGLSGIHPFHKHTTAQFTLFQNAAYSAVEMCYRRTSTSGTTFDKRVKVSKRDNFPCCLT